MGVLGVAAEGVDSRTLAVVDGIRGAHPSRSGASPQALSAPTPTARSRPAPAGTGDDHLIPGPAAITSLTPARAAQAVQQRSAATLTTAIAPQQLSTTD